MALGPLQVIPRGLLGFLRLKTLGRFPGMLSEEVRASIDLMPFWLNQQIEHIPPALTPTGTIATGSGLSQLFTTNGITVPTGEIWWVRNYMVQAGVPASATDSIVDLMGFIQEDNAHSYVVGDARSAIAVATSPFTNVRVSAKDFWVMPGSQFGFAFARATLAAAQTCSATLSWVRFPV